MMKIEGATVTLPLEEFDGLRADGEEFQRLAKRIAACFEYEFKDNGEPAECKSCKKENPVCTKCKVFKKSPPWEEILTVDVERLIKAVKQYALYGKDIEADVEEATVIIKKRGADK
ncbi:MAG: hypothetical protein OSJ43_05440 [Oscillospiraceae bacterium]|nr:hypothetical protein [Oscillospiraceae bacterium]